MKRALSYAAGIIGFAIGLFATTALAQTTANGPYYASPSWDQTLPSGTRFIVLSNFNSQAVLDRETGLVWERSPTLSGDWTDVSRECIARTTGGRYGWRLPTIQEFGSLLDPTAASMPPLPAGHPFVGIPGGALLGQFWSATESVRSPGWYYFVVWDIGVPVVQLDGIAFGNSTLRAWCVRGGLQAAPQ